MTDRVTFAHNEILVDGFPVLTVLPSAAINKELTDRLIRNVTSTFNSYLKQNYTHWGLVDIANEVKGLSKVR